MTRLGVEAVGPTTPRAVRQVVGNLRAMATEARDQPAARAAQLRDELLEHNERYFVLDDPIISDAEYDALLRALIDL